MTEVDPKAFGATLRELREARGLSQPDLGGKSGYSQQRIQSLEKGKVKHPRKVAPILAEALGTTAEFLLYRKGPRFVGPFFLTAKQVVEKYEPLEAAQKERVSKVLMNEWEMSELG